MPEVSVVTIARRESDLLELKKVLKSQTFKNFEFLYSTKKGIPQSLNDVIDKANGEIIIVTESDALPMTNTWLEEMVKAVKKYNANDPKRKTVIRGIEVNPTTWCWCNFASYASVLKKNKMDESYPIAEDTEIFARLRNAGYKGIELPIAPVFHSRDTSISRIIKNNFKYGELLVKIQMRYGQTGFRSNYVGNLSQGPGFLKRELGLIIAKMSLLLGAFIGLIVFSFKKD